MTTRRKQMKQTGLKHAEEAGHTVEDGVRVILVPRPHGAQNQQVQEVEIQEDGERDPLRTGSRLEVGVVVENQDRRDFFAEDMPAVVPRVKYLEALLAREPVELSHELTQGDLTRGGLEGVRPHPGAKSPHRLPGAPGAQRTVDNVTAKATAQRRL